jgi:hypothetical protein
VGGPDEDLDELRARLAASESVTVILHQDRELFHLRVESLDASGIEERAEKLPAKIRFPVSRPVLC